MMKILITGVLLALLAVAMLYVYSYNAKLVDAKKHWPSVAGSIIHSSVVESIREGHSGGTMDRNILTPIWKLEVRYQYSVREVVYEGDRATSEGDLTILMKDDVAPDELQALVAGKYAEGSHVNVYYNTDKPDISFLAYTEKKGLVWLLLTGVVFLCLGIFLVIRGLRGFGA